MNPDDSAQTAASARSTPADGVDPDEPSRGRSTLTIAAVTLAAVGFLSLAAILLTAFLQGDVWPGFVLATYVCLPVAFLLMVSLVAWSVVSRRRS